MKNSLSVIWEWVKPLSIAILLVVIIRNFIFSPILVDGESMMPTLQHQDRMVVTKFGEPERFDIVVFHATEEKDYIKRVIGLPGDTIEYKNDVLYINGKAYEEPYLNKYKAELENTTIGGPLTENFTLMDKIGVEKVPEGTLFVMGDNRRNSIDSRHPHIGVIPMDKIIGKTNIIYWPIKDVKFVN